MEVRCATYPGEDWKQAFLARSLSIAFMSMKVTIDSGNKREEVSNISTQAAAILANTGMSVHNSTDDSHALHNPDTSMFTDTSTQSCNAVSTKVHIASYHCSRPFHCSDFDHIQYLVKN